MHTPVLLNEVIDCLDLREGQFAIDGTINGGGHAKAMLERIGVKGTLLGVDLDGTLVARLKEEFRNDTRVTVAHGSYDEISELLEKLNLPKADRVLLDLGFSSFHVDESKRGFTFRQDEPLLMTYDENATSLREILPSLREEEIARILVDYGEERYAKRIAHAIYSAERRTRITTAKQLAEVVWSAVPGPYRRGRIHPATRTFQAFRIYANHELEHLQNFLSRLGEIIQPGGRAAIISFHSLEDRIVKNVFRDMAKAGKAKLIMKKPVAASREEALRNPRSRSAKLRAIQLA